MPHLGDAYILARSLTRSRLDSQDIVQEACLRAFRGIKGFAGENPRAWVLTIVRHTAFTWMRRQKQLPEAVEDIVTLAERTAPEEDIPTPESALILAEKSRRLRAAINTLPSAFREALLLRYERGLTQNDIARVTGVPPGTVMSRLSRARHQLAALAQSD